MSTSLRVVSLQAQNILRLSAIEINWSADQSLLMIGGKNGAGKSSAVNCVAMALGGAALCPAEPIHVGKSKGFVELDLGDLKIRREFSRDHLPCDCGVTHPGDMPIVGDDQMHTEKCATHKWGDVKSRLVVRNADGITQGTPQAILDKLIGKMTFDPMAFVNLDPKPQEDILRKIVNLDVSAHEATRKAAFERRAELNRQHKDAVAVLTSMPTFDDAPTAEISAEEIAAELRRAEELRALARDAVTARDDVQRQRDDLMSKKVASVDRVARLQAQLSDAQREVSLCETAIAEKDTLLTVQQQHVEKTAEAVPDVSSINQRLADINTTNQRVRANRAFMDANEAAKKLFARAVDEGLIIDEAEAAKRAALDAAQFPVPGLSLSDSGVTFNNVPFKQASTAEQIRVSVAIGFALHPKLRLLLVKNGNALDDDSLALIASEARTAGGQILMEYVTKDAADVSVFIEDGHTV
jgi:hypothetical protein